MNIFVVPSCCCFVFYKKFLYWIHHIFQRYILPHTIPGP